jgi:hypothetical protein
VGSEASPLHTKRCPATRAAARTTACLLAGLAGIAAAGTPAAAQDENGRGVATGDADRFDAHMAAAPLVRTTRITGGISLDGRLDEPEWQLVPPATGFIQTDPHEGRPATERTEVYVLYTDAALYIGARLWDSTGDVRKRLGRRDSMLMDSDWFSVMLDSYHDHVNAYQFSVNPAGVKRDEITTGQWRGDSSWDAVWDVATAIDGEGWTVEMRIPFSQLRFGRDSVQIWGIQFSRRMIAKEENSVLAFTPRSMRGGPSRYGHLVGLEGIRPGKRLEALPYVASRAEYLRVDSDNPYRTGRDWFASTGVDLKYRVTSSLTLDATLNPDFGQVEVDPAVVNLTAFETSFDEKRPFFIEGADIFKFGDVSMFYSRRIGRTPQGGLPAGVRFADRPDATTILGAAKLTGQTAAGWRLGALAAATARETADFIGADGGEDRAVIEPGTGYVVTRADRSLRRGESSVGAVLTAMHRRSEPGLDALLRSSALAGGVDFSHEFLDRTWVVAGYLAGSRVAGSPAAMVRTQRSSARYFQRPDAAYVSVDSAMTSMDGYAGRLELRKIAGEHWRGEARVSVMSPGFEINDVGFQTGVDRIGTDLNVQYVENRPGSLFRNYRISVRTSREWNYGWDAQGGRVNLGLNGQFANYWGGGINVTQQFPAYDDRLTRGGPMALDPQSTNIDFNLNTDFRRQYTARVSGAWSWNAADGWNRRLSVNGTIRPAENWSVTVGPSVRQSYSPAQYIMTVIDGAATATYGRRYVFAPLDQTTVSMDTRVNVNLTPNLSLEMFAQPFVSSADFGDAVQLRAPRTFAFDPYAGEVADRDFNTRSLRGNAVVRWEWQPGSTLFLVWQQRRSGQFACDDARPGCVRGGFDFARDARAIFAERPENVFMVKMNYWLNL